jgi:hypothetical protein
MKQKMDYDGDGRISCDEFHIFFASLYTAGWNKVKKAQTGKLLKVQGLDHQGNPKATWEVGSEEVNKGWFDVNQWLEFLEERLAECRSLYSEDMRWE